MTNGPIVLLLSKNSISHQEEINGNRFCVLQDNLKITISKNQVHCFETDGYIPDDPPGSAILTNLLKAIKPESLTVTFHSQIFANIPELNKKIGKAEKVVVPEKVLKEAIEIYQKLNGIKKDSEKYLKNQEIIVGLRVKIEEVTKLEKTLSFDSTNKLLCDQLNNSKRDLLNLINEAKDRL